eukprot:1114757-Pelagomonas_calceolata.AAC.9
MKTRGCTGLEEAWPLPWDADDCKQVIIDGACVQILESIFVLVCRRCFGGRVLGGHLRSATWGAACPGRLVIGEAKAGGEI